MNNKYGLRSYVINLGSCEDHVYHSYVSSTVHSPKWPLNVFFTVEYRGGHGGGVPKPAIPRKTSIKTAIPHRKSMEYRNCIRKSQVIFYHMLHLAILSIITSTSK